MVDVEDPGASGLVPIAGDGTGDMDGLEGEDAEDEGFELPLDGIACSDGVPRGDLVGLTEPAGDEEESGDGICG
jgi:hypothetical protein